jgi:dTDP-4-dehydrorhamnose reductase
MTRVLVLGVTGLLGHELWRQASADPRCEAHGTARDRSAIPRRPNGDMALIHSFDAHDPTQVRGVVRLGFDVVINCIGITKQLAEDPVEAITLNALFPHQLAEICTQAGARLIHISTDCVFSGNRGCYTESDSPDPVDLYGRTKLLGEVIGTHHLTVRTSFIGHELGTKHGLLEWFLAQKGAVQGYARVYWSGFTSTALARILLELALRRGVSGLLHVGGEEISKYDLLCRLQNAFGRTDVTIERSEQPVCDRSLDNGRFRQLSIAYPGIDEMIHELATPEASTLKAVPRHD